jgi:hypothetical protein
MDNKIVQIINTNCVSYAPHIQKLYKKNYSFAFLLTVLIFKRPGLIAEYESLKMYSQHPSYLIALKLEDLRRMCTEYKMCFIFLYNFLFDKYLARSRNAGRSSCKLVIKLV